MNWYEPYRREWLPVCAERDLAPRHLFRSTLLGQDLVAWKDENNGVNVWEDRCPHRGVRLSLGFHLGNEVQCQYHGMRFGRAGGQCVYIPSRPDQKPGAALGVRTVKFAQRYSLVWACLASEPSELRIAVLEQDAILLRPMVMKAPASVVTAALDAYVFSCVGPSGTLLEAECAAERIGPLAISVLAKAERKTSRVVLVVQPVDEGTSVVHGWLAENPNPRSDQAVYHHHNDRLRKIRDGLEGRGVNVQPIETVTR
jgi:vanillate O-demethylase ferredoxin subunit